MSCPRDVDPCPARVSVWDVKSQERLAGPAEVGGVWAFAENGVVFVDGGSEVATAGADGKVRIWDAATLSATPLQMAASDDTPLPGGPLFSVAATDVSGRSMVAAQDDLGQTVVWELSGDEATAIGSLGNALRVGFTPDGQVITSSGPGAFTFRDPITLQPAGPAFPSTVPPTSYSFSDPDLSDRTVMSSSGGLGTMLWDYDSGQPMSGIIPGFRSALSPDGETIYLGAGPVGDVVRAVSLRPSDLVVEACERSGRNLTEAEWASVIGTDEARRATCPEWSL
jgi:WD40 repeat protein